MYVLVIADRCLSEIFSKELRAEFSLVRHWNRASHLMHDGALPSKLTLIFRPMNDYVLLQSLFNSSHASRMSQLQLTRCPSPRVRFSELRSITMTENT